MSTAQRLAAIALLLAAAAGAADPPGAADPVAHLESELAAAQGTDLYLVLPRDGSRLDVRARGVTLHSVPIVETAVLAYRKARAAGAPPPIPASWVVTEDVSADHRKLIAPPGLKPFPEDEAAADTAAPPEVLPDPPSAYSVRLRGGWRLDVVQDPPTRSWLDRLGRALADGWKHLLGLPVDTSPRLVLTVAAEDGRRLHQLFRRGRRILLDPREPQPGESE